MTDPEFRTLFAKHIQEDSTRFEKIAIDMWWIRYMLLGLIGGIGLIIVGVLIALFSKAIG